jgi:lysophospholipase L1-like esterase
MVSIAFVRLTFAPLHVFLALLFSISIALVWTQFHQKPKYYPELIGVKTEMKLKVAHGNLFSDYRNALYLGHLNLGPWHGHNQMRWFEDLEGLGSIETDFRLEDRAFLEFCFKGLDQTQTVVRLSANPDWGSEVQRQNSSGRIESRQIINELVPSDVWQKLRLVFTARGSGIVELAGRQLAQFNFQEPYEFSFRNGARQAMLDGISFNDSQGGKIANLSFWGARFFWPAFSAIFVLSLFLLRMGLNWRSKFRLQVLRTILLTSGIIFSIFWILDYFYFSNRYRLEHSFIQITVPAHSENQNRPIAELFNFEDYLPVWGALPKKEVYRVLFMGSSQTYGVGASESEKVWVHRAQELVQSKIPGKKFEFLNHGEAGSNSSLMLKKLKTLWIKDKPDFVVINLANNDWLNHLYSENISSMLQVCKEFRILPILMLEGNSPEFDDASLLERHRILVSLAAKYRVPFLNSHQYLKLRENYHSGFLWWDHVHLTDYGQGLLAQFFSEKFELILSQRGVR